MEFVPATSEFNADAFVYKIAITDDCEYQVLDADGCEIITARFHFRLDAQLFVAIYSPESERAIKDENGPITGD